MEMVEKNKDGSIPFPAVLWIASARERKTQRFSDVFREIEREHWEEKRSIQKISSKLRVNCMKLL